MKRTRRYRKCNWSRASAFVALAQAAAVIILEGLIFIPLRFIENLESDTTTATSVILTYLAFFVFAFIYELLLVWDAFRGKNTIQVFCICLYNVSMFTYFLIQNSQVSNCVEYSSQTSLTDESRINLGFRKLLFPALVTMSCMIGTGTVLLSFVARKICAEFAWKIYRNNVSADVGLKNRYLIFQVNLIIALTVGHSLADHQLVAVSRYTWLFLKFNSSFFLGFTIRFLVIAGKRFSNTEFYLTLAAIPAISALLLWASVNCSPRIAYSSDMMVFLYFAAMAHFVF